MSNTAERESIAELAAGLPPAASHAVTEALLGPKAGDLHLGDARITLQLVLAVSRKKAMDLNRMAWPSLAAAIALLAALDGDRLEARARCGFSHRELYWSLQSDMYGFHTGGITGARRFGRCLPCAIGKPGKCGAGSAAWFCRRRLSLLDTRHLAPRTKTAALLMDGVTLLPSRSAGHVLARGLTASGQPQGPSRKTVGPPPGPQDDDRVSLFDRSTWSEERLGGALPTSEDKPETFVAQARNLLDSLQGMTPEEQWRWVSHACTKRYCGCLKRLAGKESRKRKQAHQGAEAPPLVEAELAATELRRWPDYALLMMADETDDCLPAADIETSPCFLNEGTRAAAAEMQPAAFGMPPWHIRPDMLCPGAGVDSPRAQQRSPISRRSSTPFRRTSGPHQRSPAPLLRRGSAEARLQRLPAEHQAAALPAVPSAPGNIRPSRCRPMSAGCSIDSPAAAMPLPPGCGPQAAYQQCKSFFAWRLPADDIDSWAPQGVLPLPVHTGWRPGDWGTGLQATQSADCSATVPAQLQLQLPHLLPSYHSAPFSVDDSCSQPSSARRRCSSSQVVRSEDQTCSGGFSVCTRSDPVCGSMGTTPRLAMAALPARSFSVGVPLGHPAALVQRLQHDVPSHIGGWHQVQSVFALVDGASEAAQWSSGSHNISATPDSEVWGSGMQLAAGCDLQLRPPSTVPQQCQPGVQEPGYDVVPQHPSSCCQPVGQSAAGHISSRGCDGSGGTAFAAATALAAPVIATGQYDWLPPGSLMQDAPQWPQLPSAAHGNGSPQSLHDLQALPAQHDSTGHVAAHAALDQSQRLKRDPSQETEPNADRQDSLALLLRQSSLGQLFRQESLAAMGSSGLAAFSPAMVTEAAVPSSGADAAAATQGGALADAPSCSCDGRALSRPPSLQRDGSSASLSGWRSVDWDAVVLEALEGTDILEDFLPPASSV